MADFEDVVIRITARNLTKAEFDKARKSLDDLGKKTGLVEGSSRKLKTELERGLNKALNQLGNQGGFATGALGKLGLAGGLAAAAIGGLTLTFSKLISESKRLTEESKKLGISTDEYQKSLGITIGLSEEAIEVGNRLGKTWGDLSQSALNLALNAAAISFDFLEDLALRGGAKTFGLTTEPTPKPFVGPVLSPGQIADNARATAKRLDDEKKGSALRERLAEEEIRNIARLSEAHAHAAHDAAVFWEEAFDKIGQASLDALPSIGGRFAGTLFDTQVPVGGRFAGAFLGQGSGPGVDFSPTVRTAEVAQASLGDLNREMANFAHLADVLGPKWASAFQGLSLGLSGIQGIQSGASTLSSTTGILGTLSGIAGIAGGVGALAAPIIALLQGLGGPDIGRDAGRDIGANISEELERAIKDSGQNVQMFLREMFDEGAIGLDRFAEEVGDLFSFFERGDISEKSLMGELSETLPILIEHFDELGESGQAQLERIMDAAKQAGIDLGVMGDELERLQAGIPEMTLEQFASSFGMTPEQQAALQGLGLGIQTEAERAATDLDVPLELLTQLGPQLEALGLSIEELPEFLDSAGIDLQEFLGHLTLPPEVSTAFADFFKSQPTPEETGAAFANHLLPGFNAGLDRLGETIIRGLRDAIAQGA